MLKMIFFHLRNIEWISPINTTWKAINGRLATINVLSKRHRVAIIAAYGPNEDATQMDKDEFFNQLNWIFSCVGNQRDIMALGDLNARVGKDHGSNIAGKYGEDTINNNGQRLIEVCQQQKINILTRQYLLCCTLRRLYYQFVSQ